MFFKFNDPKIRYIGRWATEGDWSNSISSTACGAKIEFAFTGTAALLHFDTENNVQPYPHLWITVDNGAKTEVPVYEFIRLEAASEGKHRVTIIFKSAVESQHRWYSPLVGKISFMGVTANKLTALPENTKKTIEIVGDSITEGVLIDENISQKNEINCRPFQDDVTATYAYLTAQALDLEPYIMGYGGVGTTHGGQGAVPKCVEAYSYCFNNRRKTYNSCDYILINHGANDQWATAENYIRGYAELLDLIIAENPHAKIIVLSAFCGAHHKELGEFIAKYNESNCTAVHFIDSTGWVPKEPLHPLREGHRIIADHLIPILKEIL